MYACYTPRCRTLSLRPAHSHAFEQEFQLDYTGKDALHMTMSIFSGMSNEFELQLSERPPLPFHQLKQGAPISATSSPLFTCLPIKLVERLVLLLQTECLSTFARVNRDCRLLARAIQFEHIHLKYRDVDMEIANTLSHESAPSATGPDNPSLDLGPCIQRLTANTIRGYFSNIGNVPTMESFVWHGRSDPPFQFFQENVQLNGLSLLNCTADFIDTAILPLRAAQYETLQSLQLFYVEGHTVLSETATSLISRLRSLTKLHLQLEHRIGWRRTWLVHHKSMRDCIKHPLALKMFMLSGDT